MMHLTVDSESVQLIEDDEVDVTVNIGDEGEETLCQHCGEPIAEHTEGWLHEEGNSRLCNQIDFDDIRSDLDLDDDAEVTEEMILEETDYTLAEPPEKTIRDFVNWAGITVKDDRVEVQISVGEPHGCFTMQVRQGEDENGNPCLYLHMPYPGESQPHMPTVRVSESTLRIPPN